MTRKIWNSAREKRRACRDRRLAVNVPFIAAYKAAHPCVDCGATERLHFDHVDPKKKRDNIADLVPRLSVAGLLAEIARCEVRCFDCHVRRTKRQGERGEIPNSAQKLSDLTVILIRALRRAGVSTKALSFRFCLNRKYVQRLCCRSERPFIVLSPLPL